MGFFVAVADHVPNVGDNVWVDDTKTGSSHNTVVTVQELLQYQHQILEDAVSASYPRRYDADTARAGAVEGLKMSMQL